MQLVLLLLSLALPDGAFVGVEGRRFVIGAHPFAFVGANLEVMHGATREKYQATLDAARSDGLTVGRVWALGEGAADASPWRREHELFRVGPDQFVEESFAQLDRVLAAARQDGIRLVITVANYWSDYGGVPQYLAWAGLPGDGFAARDRFYSDDKTRQLYRAHLLKLLERTNSLTGVRYADDPTIFAWELMNESQVVTQAGAIARRDFIDEMARLVKSRDRHHLVTPGLLGYSVRADRAEWLAVCRLPSVDYCDSHLYPDGSDRVASRERLRGFIDDRVQLAHNVAKKPIVFGEFGFRTTRANFLARPRAQWFGDFLERLFYDGGDGAMAWIYQPWSGTPRDFGIYIDRPDTDDVRAQLRSWAARVTAHAPAPRNPRLTAARGDTMMYDPYETEHRSPHQHLAGDAIELAPAAFSTAKWERTGTYGAGAALHAYGAGDGFFEWRFFSPAARHPVLVARVSSEWPGTTAPPDGGSRVRIYLDDKFAGSADAIPDDGVGRPVRIALPPLRAGAHRLRLAVAGGPDAHGLCVYGDENSPLRIALDAAVEASTHE